MFVIGLTGGIGAGKSQVARILKRLGAVVIDADALGHEAYRKGGAGWQEVVKAFGKEVLLPNGEIDRKRLGSVVFSNPESLVKLNSIVHPKIRQGMEQQLQELGEKGTKVAVLEAAVLIEAGWADLADEVWTVEAPENTVIVRLVSRNSLSPDEIKRRMQAQLPSSERARHAQVIVDNSGSLQELEEKVRQLWNIRVKERVA